MGSKKATLVIAAATALALLVGVSVAPAAPSRDSHSIWIVTGETARTTQLGYGASFKAGYASRAKEPWAYAQCWANGSSILGVPNQGTYTPGDPIWSGYRSLTGLTGDTFLLSDPIQQLWLGGGATCKLSLVSFSGGKQSTLASTDFTVSG